MVKKTKETICEHCGNVFTQVSFTNSRFCSMRCVADARRIKNTKTKKCVVCGNDFSYYKGDPDCCSNACRKELTRINREMVSIDLRENKYKVCEICGKKNIPWWAKWHTCSKECKKEYIRLKSEKFYKTQSKFCVVCGETFFRRKNEGSTSFKKRKTCGIKCFPKLKKVDYSRECIICGKKFSSRNRETMCCSVECTAIYKQKPTKCSVCGTIYISNNGTGKMCDSCKAKLGTRKMFVDELKAWKLSVHKKDNCECFVCGCKDDLNAHHIYQWADNRDIRFLVENGITLCREHHVQVHKMYKSGTLSSEELWQMVYGNTLVQATFMAS